MHFLFFKSFRIVTYKEEILLDAGRSFTELSKELLSRNLDDESVWTASGHLNKTIHATDDERELIQLRKMVRNRTAIYTYVNDVQKESTRKFQNEIRSDFSTVKEQNSMIGAQNDVLINLAYNAQQESIGLKAEIVTLKADAEKREERAKESEKKSKRMNFVYFALGVVLTYSPTAAKKLGLYTEVPSTPAGIERKIELHNHYHLPPKQPERGKEESNPIPNYRDVLPPARPRHAASLASLRTYALTGT